MGITPGASSNSNSLEIRTHLSCLVTPGRAALSTTRRFTNRLIKADLPTLGKPITTARTGRGNIPR